jgi:hypothetical protein
MGGVFDDNGVYLLNSQSGEGVNKVIILEKMNKDTIIIDKTKNLSWVKGTIANAVEYKVQIYASASSTEYSGGNTQTPSTPTIEYITTQTSVSLLELFDDEQPAGFEDYSNVKSLRIVITAMGNGTSVITSASQTQDFPNQNS